MFSPPVVVRMHRISAFFPCIKYSFVHSVENLSVLAQVKKSAFYHWQVFVWNKKTRHHQHTVIIQNPNTMDTGLCWYDGKSIMSPHKKRHPGAGRGPLYPCIGIFRYDGKGITSPRRRSGSIVFEHNRYRPPPVWRLFWNTMLHSQW